MDINFLNNNLIENIGFGFFGVFGAGFISLFISFLGIFAYSVKNALRINNLRNEVLRNSKEGQVFTETMVRAAILKKYPNAFDYEPKTLKIFLIVFGISFLISIISSLLGFQIIKSILPGNKNSTINTKVINGEKVVQYQDPSGRFSFYYPEEYKIETNEGVNVIYQDSHRNIKAQEPQKYQEMPYMQITFKAVSELPVINPEFPQLKKTSIGNKIVYIGAIAPSQIENKHYFVKINGGFLEFSIEPFVTQPINYDYKLKNISKILDDTVFKIVATVETNSK